MKLFVNDYTLIFNPILNLKITNNRNEQGEWTDFLKEK